MKELELIRAVAIVARAGSFRHAERLTGQSYRTLEKRVRLFEAASGHRIFHRTRAGLVPTEEGRAVVAEVNKVDAMVRAMLRTASEAFEGEPRLYTLSATEGLATFWIQPRLEAFETRFPESRLVLRPGMNAVDMETLEVDLSIQYERPKRGDIKISRLATVNVCLCAAPGYIAEHGAPKSVEELRDHRFVVQDNVQFSHKTFIENVAGTILPESQYVNVESSSGHYMTVLRGAGLGLIPTYGFAIGCELIPLELDVHTSFPLYLCFNRDARNDRRLGEVIDWLKELFDPRANPWFRSEYIPEHEFGRLIEELGIADTLDRYRFKP